MATLQTAVRTVLTDNTELTNVLTGGIHDEETTDRLGLTPETPGIYDGQKLKPCAMIRWRGDAQYGPHFTGERRFFEIYFYEDDGIANLETAKRLTKNLLHRRQVSADGAGLCWINWVDGGANFIDDALGGAAADFSRFEVIYTRS